MSIPLSVAIFECHEWSIIVGDLRERLVRRALIRVFLRVPAALRGVASAMAIDQRLTRSLNTPPVSNRIEFSSLSQVPDTPVVFRKAAALITDSRRDLESRR
jgi:hypothetical protein